MMKNETIGDYPDELACQIEPSKCCCCEQSQESLRDTVDEILAELSDEHLSAVKLRSLIRSLTEKRNRL